MGYGACRHARKDGRNGFASPELAGRFRAAAFASHGLRQPGLAGGAPKTVTLLTAVGGEEVMRQSRQGLLAAWTPAIQERAAAMLKILDAGTSAAPDCAKGPAAPQMQE